MAHFQSVLDTDTRFSVDVVSRQIRNASSKKTILIQHDHNSERFTFELPRYIEGHDMSLCNKAEARYLNISSGKCAGNARETLISIFRAPRACAARQDPAAPGEVGLRRVTGRKKLQFC
jgi:hypothetical protein